MAAAGRLREYRRSGRQDAERPVKIVANFDADRTTTTMAISSGTLSMASMRSDVVDVRVVEHGVHGVGEEHDALAVGAEHATGSPCGAAMGQGGKTATAPDDAGHAFEVVDVLPGDLVHDDLLKAIERTRAGPSSQMIEEGDVQSHPPMPWTCPGRSRQGERGLAQAGLRRAPPVVVTVPPVVPLDDDQPATEVDRQFGGGLAGPARAVTARS